MVSVKTYAKIIISGEHSVVYGHPAIAIPFKEIYSIVEISKAKTNLFIFNNNKYLFSSIPDMYLGFLKLIEYFNDKYQITEPVIIKINSNIPDRSGFGQSASIGIGIAKALLKYNNLSLNDNVINELVNISEEFYHNRPSGIDQAAIMRETPIYFISGKVDKYINYPNKGYLLICNTPIKGLTETTVSYIQEKEAFYRSILTEVSEVTNDILLCWENKNLIKLGKLLEDNQRLLKELNLSINEIDNLIIKLQKLGSLGAKLTGKGRGGAVFALFDNLKLGKKAIKALKKEGYKELWLIKI